MEQSKNDSKNIAPENNRRKALKKALITGSIIATGSALPKNWARPVVDSIILPAHAATTDEVGSAGGNATTTAAPTTVNYFYQRTIRAQLTDSSHTKNSFAERALNMVIPTAAAESFNAYPSYVCLAITGNTFTARIVRRPYADLYQDFNGISGTVDNELFLDSASQPCSQTNIFPFTLKVDQVTANSCRCTLTDQNAFGSGGPIVLTVLRGACGQPNLSCAPD